MSVTLTTPRLLLEPLSAASHYGGMRRMGADPAIMRYITGAIELPEQTLAFLSRVEARWAEQGYSWWALIHNGDMVGAATLQHIAGAIEAPFEIGWRLSRSAHGQGFATEAARAMLAHAKSQGIGKVLAIANPANQASIAVMRRLGMVYQGVQTHYNRRVDTYGWDASLATVG